MIKISTHIAKVMFK